jgi:hypothetical protein
VSHLAQHHRGPHDSLFDETVLQEVAENYYNNNEYRDDLHMLYHVSIIDGLEKQLNETGGDKQQASANFPRWFRLYGKSVYLYEIIRPATSADDKARWGSEIELGALAEALNTNLAWQKQEGMQIVGVMAGIVPESSVPNALIDKLVRFGFVEFVMQRDTAGNQIPSLRFKQDAGSRLMCLTGRISAGEHPLSNENIQQIVDGWTPHRERRTAYGYLTKELGQAGTAMAMIAREIIIRSTGQFITDDNGQPDIHRILRLAAGLSRNEADLVKPFIRPSCSPLFTVVYRGGHYSYLPAAAVLPALDPAEPARPRVAEMGR